MPVDIQIISDIHLEFLDYKNVLSIVTPSAKILALLGDICCVGSTHDFEIYKKFINDLLPYYEHIIIITGNHEYFYNPDVKNKAPTMDNTMRGVNRKIKIFCKTSPKLHFLYNSTFKFKSGKTIYHVLGTTLWSDIPTNRLTNIKNNMNDYRFIYITDKKTNKVRLITPQDTVKLYKKNIKFLHTEIVKIKDIRDKNKHEIIVFSHHKPYQSNTYSLNTLDPAYESNLVFLFKPPVTLWGYGHTHKYDKSIRASTLLYSNPRGYPRQKTGYKKEETIRLK